MVKGFEQRFEIDYKETFATVVKSMTYKVLFAIAVFYDYELEQMDVKMAFLNGDLDEEVYVVQSTGYEKGERQGVQIEESPIWVETVPSTLVWGDARLPHRPRIHTTPRGQ